MGSADLRVVFRVGDNKTAEYISEQLGDTEMRTYGASSGKTAGQNATGGATASESSGQSYSTSTARVFDAAEVLKLEPGRAIVLYRGSGARFNMPRYDKDYPASKPAVTDRHIGASP